MARVFGPALSLAAHGTIGGTLTFQRRPSGYAVMRPPRPSAKSLKNPTAAQQTQRAVIKARVQAWQALAPAEKAVWEDAAAASGGQLSGYHQFMKTGGAVEVNYTDVLATYAGSDPLLRDFTLGLGKLAAGMSDIYKIFVLAPHADSDPATTDFTLGTARLA